MIELETRSPGPTPFETRALLAFRRAVLGLMSLVAFEWAIRLRAMCAPRDPSRRAPPRAGRLGPGALRGRGVRALRRRVVGHHGPDRWRSLRAHRDVRGRRRRLAGGARGALVLRVSREVHDVLGHHLAGLSQHLDLARRRSEGEAAEAMARALDTVRRLLERLRALGGALQAGATGGAFRMRVDLPDGEGAS
jgi:signal transduction histidine kinase